MEGDPGVRCYHGPMADSIAIARLNAEAARVVTNITSAVANLEEGGTDPPGRPHGFQSVTRSTAEVDAQGGKDAKKVIQRASGRISGKQYYDGPLR